MKKFIALALAALMVLSLAACGGTTNTDSTTEAADKTNTETKAATETEAPGEETTAATAEEVSSSFMKLMSDAGFYDYKEVGWLADDVVDTSRKSTANSDERYPEITICTSNEIKTWAAWQTGRGRHELVMTLWEPLAYNYDGYNLELCLAKSYKWEDESNKVDLIVEIWDTIKDTDGNAITASDVKFSIEQAMGAGVSGDYNSIDHVDVVDDYTVDIVWKEACNSDVVLSTIMFTAIASEKAYNEHNFVEDPVGTGTYMLDSMVKGSSYKLVRNENYWQDADKCCSVANGQGKVDVINIEVISDRSMQYMAFENDEVFKYEIDANNIADFLEGGKHYDEYLITYELNSGRYGIEFNVSGDDPSGVMSDVNFRKAICYAIDGAGIVAALGEYGFYQVYGEAGATCNGYNEAWDAMEGTYYNTYDVELAKEYLDKTDYAGEELTIIVQSGQTCNETTAQIIMQELSLLGINATLLPLESSVLDTYKDDFTTWDAYMFMWAGDDIGQQWSRQFDYDSFEHGLNEPGMKEEDYPGFQDLIDLVQTNERTQDDIDEVQSIIYENCISYSIYGQINLYAYDKDLAQVYYSSGHKETNWGACEYYLD